MKSKISKELFPMITILSILCLPLIAGAAAIPWTQAEYQTYATVYNDVFWDFDENVGPSFPLSAYYNYDNGFGTYGTASSNITESHMDVQASSYEMISGADAIFIGRYTGTSDLFQFVYDVNTGNYPLWFSVYDYTTSSNIYDYQLSTGSGVLSLNTPVGHDLQIDVILSAGVDSSNQGPTTDNASLNYNMSLLSAPEPISSILFITGGTLLAGRRFLRRKA